MYLDGYYFRVFESNGVLSRTFFVYSRPPILFTTRTSAQLTARRASLAGAFHAARTRARRCMMHAAAAALVAATVAYAFVWSGLLWQLWVLRHTFEIAARAPNLVGVCGVSTLVFALAVLVHWILLSEGQGLPCYAMLLSSYLCECVQPL